MNEKRFRLIRIDDYVFQIKDIDNDLYFVAEQICNLLNEQQATIERLNRRLDYETRMHKKWKDDCLAILEEQVLNDCVKELQKSKKSGWDSEPNTDYVTRVKEGLK